MFRGLTRYVKPDDWTARWARCPGMVVVQVQNRALELKPGSDIPCDSQAVGCGGWNPDGLLEWVGIDLDVGHGRAESQYATFEDAVDAALKVRELVGGAAEIRRSKSGNGVHIRVAISAGVRNGRKTAPLIAKWLARQIGLKCDTAVLGRQNLWFWSKGTGELSFAPISECDGEWTPPAEAMQEYRPPAPAPRAVSVGLDRQKILERAALYLDKVDPAVSGSGGHDQTFKAACALVQGFALSVDEARPLLYAWNRGCQPPWSDRELEHKLKEAEKAGGERGKLLRENRPDWTPRQSQPPVIAPPPSSVDSPATQLIQQLRDEVSGKRYACDWPFPLLGEKTQALLPGTVTLLCSPKGSSKSFFVTQCLQYWQKCDYEVACLMLEEDLVFHLRRALAQHLDNSSLSDPKWIKANPDFVAQVQREHADWLNSIAEIITAPQSSMNTGQMLGWLTTQMEAGKRIVVVDPITVREQDRDIANDDKRLINGAKALMTRYGASCIFTCHPPKTTAKDRAKSDGGWGDDVAGGAALQNLASNIFYLEYLPQAEEFEAVGADDSRNFVRCNRKMQLRKTRNAGGQGYSIGYYFDGRTLKFAECGLLDR